MAFLFTKVSKYRNMKEFVLIMGGTYGTLAVIFGAFGAHGLKNYLDLEQLKSFEIGRASCRERMSTSV